MTTTLKISLQEPQHDTPSEFFVRVEDEDTENRSLLTSLFEDAIKMFRERVVVPTGPYCTYSYPWDPEETK